MSQTTQQHQSLSAEQSAQVERFLLENNYLTESDIQDFRAKVAIDGCTSQWISIKTDTTTDLPGTNILLVFNRGVINTDAYMLRNTHKPLFNTIKTKMDEISA